MGLDTPKPYLDFAERVFQHRVSLTKLIESLVANCKKIVAYGASAKENVLLQFSAFTTKHIACINHDLIPHYKIIVNEPELILSEKIKLAF